MEQSRLSEQLRSNLNLGPQWEVNAGVGCGLTSSTDRLVLKLILGYRFDWGRSERG